MNTSYSFDLKINNLINFLFLKYIKQLLFNVEEEKEENVFYYNIKKIRLENL